MMRLARIEAEEKIAPGMKCARRMLRMWRMWRVCGVCAVCGVPHVAYRTLRIVCGMCGIRGVRDVRNVRGVHGERGVCGVCGVCGVRGVRGLRGVLAAVERDKVAAPGSECVKYVTYTKCVKAADWSHPVTSVSPMACRQRLERRAGCRRRGVAARAHRA